MWQRAVAGPLGALAVVLLIVAGAASALTWTGKSHSRGAISPGTTTTTVGSVAPGLTTPVPTSGTTQPAIKSGTSAERSNGATTTVATRTSSPPQTSTPVATSPSLTTTPTTSGGASLPAPGTYTYDTSGYAKVQFGLFNSTQNYPTPTQITVSKAGCGVDSVWRPNSSSSMTLEECAVPGGIHPVFDESTNTEGGQTTTEKFVCDSNAFIPIAAGVAGQKWTFTCRSSDATAQQTATLVGRQDMTVGGQTVATTHVQVVSQISGAESGTVTSDYWLTADASIVKETGSITAHKQVDAGTATYTSQYTLQLRSLKPQ